MSNDMDMNNTEPQEVNDGVPVETLVYIIGTHEVERFVYEQQAKKIQEQAAIIQQQNVMLKAELESLRKNQETVQPSIADMSQQISALQTENERLARVNVSDDERIKQLEETVHRVAAERDKVGKLLEEEALRSGALDGKIVVLNDQIASLQAELATKKVKTAKKK